MVLVQPFLKCENKDIVEVVLSLVFFYDENDNSNADDDDHHHNKFNC